MKCNFIILDIKLSKTIINFFACVDDWGVHILEKLFAPNFGLRYLFLNGTLV